jgi:hypothetical protein
MAVLKTDTVPAKPNMAHVKTTLVAIELAFTGDGIRWMGWDDAWLWDSGAPASMTPNSTLLHNFQPLVKPTQV